MVTTIELFLKLVRNALWQSEEELPEEISARMVAYILRGAKEQGLLGLVIDALMRNKVRMPEEQYLELTVMLMKVRKANDVLNKGLRQLKELFDERGIDFVVVKGQAVGVYYPNPMLRQVGDIDYYCDTQNFTKAQEALKEAWGIEEDADKEERHVSFDYKNVSYEGHFSLVMFHNKRRDRYWQQLMDESLNHSEKVSVKVDGMEVRTLPHTIHTVFIFIHIFVHLMEQGVGFRQFCDLAVMLHVCREEIDRDKMQEILKTLGMEKAYRAIGCVLTDYLGLPSEDLGCELTDKDRRYTKRIIEILKYRGNMGHYNLIKGERGWLGKVEVAGIAMSHFVKFWSLAPDFCCRLIVYRFKKNILQACGCCRIK